MSDETWGIIPQSDDERHRVADIEAENSRMDLIAESDARWQHALHGDIDE